MILILLLCVTARDANEVLSLSLLVFVFRAVDVLLSTSLAPLLQENTATVLGEVVSHLVDYFRKVLRLRIFCDSTSA